MFNAKIFTLTVVLLGIIIISSVYASRAISNTSKKIENNIESLETVAKDGDWDSARTKLKNLKNDWSNSEFLWTILIDHNEIDNIDTSISKIEKCIETKTLSLVLSETAALRQHVKHIPKKEELNLKNVL